MKSVTAVTPTTDAPRWRWLAFSAALAAAVMDLLDSTIAQVASPSIRASLGGSYADLEWISTAYTLAMAVVLLTGGRLGDLFGRRRMLLTGILGFGVASVACAAAVTPVQLIVGRAAQGALGALMLPQVFGLMRELFGPEEMGRAFGVFGPVMGLSAMVGPLVAGGLIGLDLFGLGWRMIFLVNVPVAVFALAAGSKLPAAGRALPRSGSLDLPGAALAGAGMLLLVGPLVQGQQLGWPVSLRVALAASVPVLAAFAAYQLRRKRSGRTPLLEPGIFTHRGYLSGIAFSLAFVGSMGGIVLLFNVLLQAGLGFSPWQSALATAPWAAGAFVGSGVSGVAMKRYGRRVVHTGVVIEAVGLTAMLAVLHTAGAGVTGVDLLGPMIVGGIGMGMVFVPLFDIVMAGVLPHEIGSAAGVLQSVNGLAMSLGVAGLGAVFFGLLGAKSERALDFLNAAEWTAVLTIGLLAVAFGTAFWLPRHAREMVPPAAEPIQEPELVAA